MGLTLSTCQEGRGCRYPPFTDEEAEARGVWQSWEMVAGYRRPSHRTSRSRDSWGYCAAVREEGGGGEEEEEEISEAQRKACC